MLPIPPFRGTNRNNHWVNEWVDQIAVPLNPWKLLKSTEKWWLEDDFRFEMVPPFLGDLLIFVGGVICPMETVCNFTEKNIWTKWFNTWPFLSPIVEGHVYNLWVRVTFSLTIPKRSTWLYKTLSLAGTNLVGWWKHYLDVPLEVIGSMVRINGLFHLLRNGVLIGVITDLLTFDPNLLGHPSTVDGRNPCTTWDV